MQTSHLALAEDALAGRIAAAPQIAGSQIPVDVGYPLRALENEHIWISGTVEDWQLSYATSGIPQTATDEDFALHVIVLVRRTDDVNPFVAARDRCLELIAAIQTAVKADPTLGGICDRTEPGALRRDQAADGNTSTCMVDLSIACHAQLTA